MRVGSVIEMTVIAAMEETGVEIEIEATEEIETGNVTVREIIVTGTVTENATVIELIETENVIESVAIEIGMIETESVVTGIGMLEPLPSVLQVVLSLSICL